MRFDDHARGGAGGHDGAAFAGNHAGLGVLNLENHGREVDLRIFAEGGGETLDFAFPGGAIERWERGGLANMRLRFFLGEIGGLVFFFGADGGVGANAEQRGNGTLVFAVGEFPQDAGDGVLIVTKRKSAGADAAGAALAVRVVELGSAHTHGDVGLTALRGDVVQQTAVGADEASSVVARASSVCIALRTGSLAVAAAAGKEEALSFAARADGAAESCAARAQQAATRRNSAARACRLPRVREDSEIVMKNKLQ